MDFISLHNDSKEKTIQGRYLTLSQIESLLHLSNRFNRTSVLGYSVNNRSIFKYTIGFGKIRVLMWSQMHGNESTTTKAIFDLFNFLDSDHEFAIWSKSTFTICVVPMLNPDGAQAYTRENANGIDLNRDAQDLSQPESQILRKLFIDFAPNFCYNLHDQRTIYGVGDTKLSATVSFLAPAFNEAREFHDSRNAAISVINQLFSKLQEYIPGQIARYDDSFNNNCVGDTFQMFGVPTILFEAGHFHNDYAREETRKYIFIALVHSFKAMSEIVVMNSNIKDYLSIPLNKTSFLDIIYRNININYDNSIKSISFAVQYYEKLAKNEIIFKPFIEIIDSLDQYFGHQEFDFKNRFIQDFPTDSLIIGQNFDYYIENGMKFVKD